MRFHELIAESAGIVRLPIKGHPDGLPALKNPSFATLMAFRERTDEKCLRGLIVGPDIYWCDADQTIHHHMAEALGATTDHNRDRLFIEPAPEGPMLSVMMPDRAVVQHAQLVRILQPGIVIYSYTLDDVVPGDEFLRAATSLVEAAAPVDNPKFKAWFAGSQVVDDQGKPLQVYHGTKKDIHRFDLRGKHLTGGTAFFFTPDPVFAHLYANKGGPDGGVIYPVYLRIINMFDNSNPEHIAKISAAADAIIEKERATKPYGKEMSFYPFTKDRVFAKIREGHWDAIEHPIIIAALKKCGFDGASMIEGPNQNFMVFKANQIKSVFNAGTWDLKNPKIAEGDD